MPNGFPPSSFVVETERSTTFASARGRWLAAAAILGALLLITGILLIARDDGKTDVATSSTTTTVFGDTTPTFSASTLLDPAVRLPEATTIPGGGAVPVDPGVGTVPGGGAGAPGGAPAPGGGPGAGALSTSATSVALGRADSGVGPATAKLILNNTGGSPLSYTTSSEFPGSLTVSPGSGNIGAGAGAEVTITLDGAKAGEGGFTGALGFTANGATRKVIVTATVVHPPTIFDDAGSTCPDGAPSCSKQIQLVEVPLPPNATACNSDWRYRVRIADESALKAVRVEASLPQFNAELRNDVAGNPSGSGTWSSASFPNPEKAIPTGTFKFSVVAIDQFDGTRRGPEQSITC